MKYKVNVGSLVTKYMERTFVVSADSEQAAFEKAEERFREVCRNAKTYTDVGGSVELNWIEER